MSSQENVLALVTFPSHIDIFKVRRRLSEDHPFLENIDIVSENTLGVRLQNIADLLDLDFINSYGAQDVKLNIFGSENKIQSVELPNFDSFKISEKELQEKPLLSKKQTSEKEVILDNKKVLRMERLTSLEDQLIEEEKIKKYFDLIPSDD